MNVPPRDREKIACPSAATITFASNASGVNLSRYQRTPSIAPGSVSARSMRMRRMRQSTGMMILLAISIPPRSPFCTTAAQATITAAVQASWRMNDFATKPESGGSTAAASIDIPMAVAASPIQ
jgi:hypothetical protein